MKTHRQGQHLSLTAVALANGAANAAAKNDSTILDMKWPIHSLASRFPEAAGQGTDWELN